MRGITQHIQRLSQGAPRIVQMPAHGLRRQPQLLTDIRRCPSFDFVQHHDLSLASRQRRHGVRKPVVGFRIFHLAVGPSNRRRRELVQFLMAPDMARLLLIEPEVHQHAHEPGSERALPVVLLDAIERAQTGVLHKIFRILFVVQQPPREPKRARQEGCDERIKRVAVATNGARHQCRITFGVGPRLAVRLVVTAPAAADSNAKV